jgi:hypothetical protein
LGFGIFLKFGDAKKAALRTSNWPPHKWTK